MKKQEKQLPKEFNSKAISLQELEERKEMVVIWRRGEGFFPEDQTHSRY